MNFLDLTEIKGALSKIPRDTADEVENKFQEFYVNNFIIQVHAGEFSFSEPKTYEKSISDYKSVQLFVYEQKGNFLSSVIPPKDDRFSYCDWVKYFHFEKKPAQYKPSVTAAFLPTDQLPAIIKDIYKISRLKIFF